MEGGLSGLSGSDPRLGFVPDVRMNRMNEIPGFCENFRRNAGMPRKKRENPCGRRVLVEFAQVCPTTTGIHPRIGVGGGWRREVDEGKGERDS